MKCQVCGKEIPEQSKFCRYCGRAQQVPAAADHFQQKPEKKKGLGAVVCVIAVLAVLALLTGAGFFVFRSLTGGGNTKGTTTGQGGRREKQRDEEEDDEEDREEEEKEGDDRGEGEEEKDRETEGSSKSRKRSGLNSYLTYMGTKFENLPESFEREIAVETEGFSVILAKEDVRYAGIDGKMIIEGFEFSDEDLRETMKGAEMVGLVYWQPDETSQEDMEKILEQMIEDYGEYDGSVAHHTIKNRNLGEEMGEYTLYYWDNPEGDRYDIQLFCLDGECSVGLGACEGEDDSRYLKPIEEMAEAFKNGDIDALEDVLAEEFFISMGMTRADLEHEFEGTARIVIDVKGVERLPWHNGLSVLMMEYEIAADYESGLVNHIYFIDAMLKQTAGEDTEETPIRFITAKKDGKWKILHWETE